MKHFFMIFAVTAAGLCCAGTKKAGFLHNGVTAHRGNSWECTENTLPAFKSAIAIGADWIELDIYLTKDGQVVVCHDRDTARVGDKNLSIANSTYKELLTVDVATGFRKRHKLSVEKCPPQRMPLLEDVLKLIMTQNRSRLSLQPKNECVKPAFEIISRMGAEKWVGFNDGNLRKMQQVKEINPEVPVFWDRPAKINIDKDIKIALQSGFESMVVNEHGMTRKMVDQIKKAGLESGVWTVTSEAKLKRFLNMGVQRIYTDNPALLLRLKKESDGR